MSEKFKATLFGLFLFTMMLVLLAGVFVSMDWTQPILSERNPNGTVDYWYIGRNAEI